MTTTLPGLAISILRSQTFGPAEQPINISGRVTGFGFPLPALVRVTLDGPDHNPEQLHFNTLSTPTGDYSVAVLPPKDGQYQVFAQAFFPVAVPVPFGGAENLFTGPPLATSASPPLSIGRPVDSSVVQDLGEGVTRRVAQPPPTQIEISAPITIGGFGDGLPAGGGQPPFLIGFPGPGQQPPPGPPALPEPPDEPPETPSVSGRIVSYNIT